MNNDNFNDFSKITVESYEGPEPYLFVSYSHRDAKAVNEVLQKIDREKFRIWYDDTMEIGDDFREELRTKIEHSAAILLFISNSSIQSKYCGMEIITAFKYEKRIYPIYLEDDVNVPPALSMILDNLQHVKSEAINSEKYISKLIASLPTETMRALNVVDGVLIKCKDGSPIIEIPDDVIAIGNAAFKNCEKLENIIIGDNVKSLGSEAFRGCKSLLKLVLPASVKRIGESSFRDCISLKELVVSNPDVEIGERAFENCANLVSISLPASMSEIYGGVFNSCKALESIILPEKLTILGESSLADCIRIKEINIPDDVTKIDDMVFNGCTGLEKIKLSKNLTKIGKNAFKDCSSLSEIFIPASVTNIGMSPFKNCVGLKRISVDAKNKYFKTVDDILFNKSKSTLICFPACLDKTEYSIPDSVTVISDWAFCECGNLRTVNIPDSVYEIGEGAFYKCTALSEIIIPDSVTRIDDTAFRGCTNLKKITIPDSVKDFGWGIFNGCENVTVICSDNSFAASYCQRKNIKHHSM